MDKTEQLLKRDSVRETEKLFEGKHNSKFNENEESFMLLKYISDNEEKGNHLQEIGDTYTGIKWHEFINIIETIGFKIALKYDFSYEKNIEEAIIYYHLEKGLVIWATSRSNKNYIYDGKLYGEVYSGEDNWQNISQVLTSSHDAFVNPNNEFKKQVGFSFNIREGLVHNINKVEKVTLYVPVWLNKHFLWFVDYAEKEIKDYDYEKITKDKIKMCPEEFQKIVDIYLIED